MIKRIASFFASFFPKASFKNLGITIISVGALFLCSGCSAKKPQKKHIGVLIERDHSSLKEILKGVFDSFSSSAHIVFHTEIIHGKRSSAHKTAKRFVDGRYTAAIGLGTMAAQALAKESNDPHLPLLFGGVSDPSSALLKGNITGVSDFVSPSRQFKELKEAFPAFTHYGVIYNPEEANSKSLVRHMKEQAGAFGITLSLIQMGEVRQAKKAVNVLKEENVHVIFINNDNTATEAIHPIIQAAKGAGIPVFSTSKSALDYGAHAYIGPDYYALGKQLGLLLKTALKRKDVEHVRVRYPEEIQLNVSKDFLKVQE
jgi:putative ABC transport system substrate-binding protein